LTKKEVMLSSGVQPRVSHEEVLRVTKSGKTIKELIEVAVAGVRGDQT